MEAASKIAEIRQQRLVGGAERWAGNAAVVCDWTCRHRAHVRDNSHAHALTLTHLPAVACGFICKLHLSLCDEYRQVGQTLVGAQQEQRSRTRACLGTARLDDGTCLLWLILFFQPRPMVKTGGVITTLE